jgi:hypothetical protein
MKVQDARDAYLEENGFTADAYGEPWTWASFLGVRFALPNTAKHRWGIMLHDLHHVATGFGTDLAGEGEISVWELAAGGFAGLRALGPYVGSIVMSGALLGVVLAPRRAFHAWRAARGAHALFAIETNYDELLAMNVGALRDTMGVPRAGLADRTRELHSHAPRSNASSHSLHASPPA